MVLPIHHTLHADNKECQDEAHGYASIMSSQLKRKGVRTMQKQHLSLEPPDWCCKQGAMVNFNSIRFINCSIFSLTTSVA